jgi:hypothetical protein
MMICAAVYSCKIATHNAYNQAFQGLLIKQAEIDGERGEIRGEGDKGIRG